MSLTAVILVEPETPESDLARARRSIAFADEILLWKEEKPITDFASVRNRALQKASGEWVLFLDSDEEVTTPLAEEIQQVVRSKIKDQKAKIGYSIRRQDYFLGHWLQHGETASIRLLRLARKDAGKWDRPVHEVWKINVVGEEGQLTDHLRHYSHSSIIEMFAKIDRYSTIEAHLRESHQDTTFQSLVELSFFPKLKFLQNYVFRLGFLDGMPGFLMAFMMSFHSFLVRAKTIEFSRKK